MTELWYEGEAEGEVASRDALDYITKTIMPDEIVEDENRIFDRRSFRILTVEEVASDLAR